MRFSKALLSFGMIAASVLILNTGAMADDQPTQGLAATAKEIFLKGSIDGKHMFMVLGLGDAADVSKDITKWAVNLEDFIQVGKDINNKDHQSDYVWATQTGWDGTKWAVPRIFTKPWETITQDIPQSFQADIGRAEEGYNSAKSPLVGSLKSAGWGAVAVIQGLAYVVIEIPFHVAFNTAVGAAAIPVMETVQTVILTAHVAKIAIKIACGLTALAAVNAYSVLSTAVAGSLVAVVSGVIAVWSGGKFLFYNLPRKLLMYPVSFKLATGLDYDQVELVATTLKNRLSQSGYTEVSKIGRFRSKIKLMTNESGKQIEYALIRVRDEKSKVVVIGEISKAYYKLQMAKNPGIAKKALKEQLKAELYGEVAEAIRGILPTGDEKANPVSLGSGIISVEDGELVTDDEATLPAEADIAVEDDASAA